jgi:hypothetical protein
MGWSTVYFVLAIIAGVLGIWNLARQRNVFLAIAGVLWFLIVLFEHYVPGVYRYVLISGVPSVGSLLLYVFVPILIILAYFAGGRR